MTKLADRQHGKLCSRLTKASASVIYLLLSWPTQMHEVLQVKRRLIELLARYTTNFSPLRVGYKGKSCPAEARGHGNERRQGGGGGLYLLELFPCCLPPSSTSDPARITILYNATAGCCLTGRLVADLNPAPIAVMGDAQDKSSYPPPEEAAPSATSGNNFGREEDAQERPKRAKRSFLTQNACTSKSRKVLKNNALPDSIE